MFRRLKEWWADDWNFWPRTWRDLKDKRVGLWTYTYDPQSGYDNLEYTHVPRRDLPADALHVTGKNSEFFLDKVDSGTYPLYGQITAVDLYLWMNNNEIDQALANKKGWELPVDWHLLALAVGACVILGLLAMFLLG